MLKKTIKQIKKFTHDIDSAMTNYKFKDIKSVYEVYNINYVDDEHYNMGLMNSEIMIIDAS